MDRPLGVSILSVLHIIGGALALLMTPLLVVGFMRGGDEAAQVFERFGFTPAVILVAIGLLGALALASGVGMWMGRAWGWRLATFYYANRIVTNAAAAVTFATNDELQTLMAEAERPVSYYVTKHAVRGAFSVWFLLYLLSGRPVRFFGVAGSRRWMAMTLGVVVGLVMLAF